MPTGPNYTHHTHGDNNMHTRTHTTNTLTAYVPRELARPGFDCWETRAADAIRDALAAHVDAGGTLPETVELRQYRGGAPLGEYWWTGADLDGSVIYTDPFDAGDSPTVTLTHTPDLLGVFVCGAVYMGHATYTPCQWTECAECGDGSHVDDLDGEGLCTDCAYEYENPRVCSY